MWFLLIYIQLTSIYAQRIALRGSSHPCEGRLEVYHEGQWGLVGNHRWNDYNGMVVCKSLGCGDHVKSGVFHHIYANLPSLTNFWMDEIQCNGTEKKLWDCTFNGWNITQCNVQNYVSVYCSGRVSLRLNLNGITDACAGVIQFTTTNETFRVCSSDWNINKVCQELNCGKHKQTITSGTINAKGSSNYVTLKCIGNEDFLWQCMEWGLGDSNTCQGEISVICSNYTNVRLHGSPDVCEGYLEKYTTEGDWVNVPCQDNNFDLLNKMCANLLCGTAVDVKPCNESKNTWLKCSDRVTVEWEKSRENPSVCYGDIYIIVNGSQHAVCSDSTTSFEKIGEVVCREMQCGTPLSVLQGSKKLNQISFKCQGHEKSLWECHKNVTGGNCQPIKIICSGSVEMHLINGLDKCGGQLELKLEDSWQSINYEGWSIKNSDMVCHHLQCGEFMSTSPHRFVRSKSPLLQWKLTCNGINITQCTMAEEKYRQVDSTVNIICYKHELWFLQGNLPCEGRVKNENDEYLQNITNEKATEVCKRNFCGQANVITKNKTSNMNTFFCSENTTSSDNCTMKNISTEPDFPFVKCSGSMEVRLQNTCHGKVLVWSDKNYGVCRDTWTVEQSRMLCKVLGCGQAITDEYIGKEKSELNVASVHCSPKAENFSQCNFVKLDSSLCQKQAYVSCTGSVKAVLQDLRDKCAGNLQLFYAGALQPLCDSSVNNETQNVICASLGCGKALSFTKAISSISNSRGLKKLTCKDGNISNCDFSEAKEYQCHVGHLRCTGWRRLLLTNHETACSGNVYLQNQNETHYFAVNNDSWGKPELNELCKYLECGKISENKAIERLNLPTWSRKYECPVNPKSIWDCEKEKETMGKHHLYINCTDEPEVSLNPLNKRKCVGEVMLKNERMCHNSQKTESVLQEFCQHMGCSMLFKTWSTQFVGSARYLSCTGNENKLWQCSSWTDKCEGVISLACTEGIKWKLSRDCGGDLQVDYRGKWEPVCPVNQKDADKICSELNCGKAVQNDYKDVENTENPHIRIRCDIASKHLMHCIRTGAADCTKSAVIHCEKSPPKIPDNPRIDTGLIVAIVVGLLLVLVAALVMFWKRKAFLTILRFKTSAEDPDVEISENEMQSLNKKDVFEMGVDDIDPMENNLSQGSASEHDEGNLNTSKGSSGTEYDDVDEENVKQPPGSTPTDPLLPLRPDNIPNQVTFEAEVETQEDYDDVILPHTMASEQTESSNIPVSSSNPLIQVPNDEVKPQKDE